MSYTYNQYTGNSNQINTPNYTEPRATEPITINSIYQLQAQVPSSSHQISSAYPIQSPQFYPQIHTDERPNLNTFQMRQAPPPPAPFMPPAQQFTRHAFYMQPQQRMPNPHHNYQPQQMMMFDTGYQAYSQQPPPQQHRPQIVPQMIPTQTVQQNNTHVPTNNTYYEPTYTQQPQIQANTTYPSYNIQFNPNAPGWTPQASATIATGIIPQTTVVSSQPQYRQETTQPTAIIQPQPQITQPVVTQPPMGPVKREKKPLQIINPNTHEPIDPTKPNTQTSSTTTSTSITNNTNLNDRSTHHLTNNTDSTKTNSITTQNNNNLNKNTQKSLNITSTNISSTTNTTNTQTVDAAKVIQSDFALNVLRKLNDNKKTDTTNITSNTTTTTTSTNVSSTNDSNTSTTPVTSTITTNTSTLGNLSNNNANKIDIIDENVNNKLVNENNDNIINSQTINTTNISSNNVISSRPGANVPKTAIPVGRNTTVAPIQQQQPTSISTKIINTNNKQTITTPITSASTQVNKTLDTATTQTQLVSVGVSNDKTALINTTSTTETIVTPPLPEKSTTSDKVELEAAQLAQKEKENKLEIILTEDNKNGIDTEISESTIELENNEEKINNKTDPVDDNINSNTMKERHSLDSSNWRPDQTEAKKRYDRDFLLKMKDKQTGKPEGLPSIPNVILDNLKPEYQSQSSYNSYPIGGRKSMDGPHSRGSMGRAVRGGGKGTKGSQHGKYIQIPTASDVELSKSENAYKTIKQLSQPLEKNEMILRGVRSILNKLTPQNFQKLIKDLVNLEINASEDRLRGTIDIIFEKSIDEPAFSQTYANLCKGLTGVKTPSASDPNKLTQFRSLLLFRCQKEFETDYYREINYEEEKKVIEEEPDEAKRKEKEELLEEKLIKAKRRSLGNIRFIGELFKLGMLTEGIMHDCINRLLKQESDEENLECLCKLLTTIGKDMDKPQSQKQMKEHFDKLEKIKRNKNSTISARIKFMILDVIELKHSNWVPRRVDNAPKTIDEIHREIQEEQKQKQIEIDRIMQLEAQKRAATQGQQRGGGRGGHHQQHSSLKSASMDSETYAANRPKNIGIKLSDVKKLTTANTELKLGPPSFNKPTFNTQKTVEQRSNILSTHIDSDNRRGSMPLGNSRVNKQYSNQTSQDYNRKLEKVKQMDRSEASSQASSRDASLNRQDQSRDNSISRASDTSICGSNPHISDVIKPIVKKPYTSDAIDRKVNNMIEEYMQNDDINEALKDIEEFQPIDPKQIEDFVRLAVQVVLERSEQARKGLGKLFYHALKDNKLDLKFFVSGLKEIFELAEDMAVDIPRIGKYIGELIAPLVHEDFNIEFLNEFFSATSDIKILGEVISEVLHCASNRLGHFSVIKIFKTSKVNVNEHLKNHPNPDFFDEKNIKWIVQTRERTQSVTISAESYENSLYDILKDSKAENEYIFDQIESTFTDKECGTKQFVRALMIAVCRSCIAETRVDTELFKKRGLILSKYINRIDVMELESLFGVQALDHRLQHPPNFIRVIFDMLYDEDIISEDAFRTWQITDREDGHAISVLSLKVFFEWLDEAEASET